MSASGRNASPPSVVLCFSPARMARPSGSSTCVITLCTSQVFQPWPSRCCTSAYWRDCGCRTVCPAAVRDSTRGNCARAGRVLLRHAAAARAASSRVAPNNDSEADEFPNMAELLKSTGEGSGRDCMRGLAGPPALTAASPSALPLAKLLIPCT